MLQEAIETIKVHSICGPLNSQDRFVRREQNAASVWTKPEVVLLPLGFIASLPFGNFLACDHPFTFPLQRAVFMQSIGHAVTQPVGAVMHWMGVMLMRNRVVILLICPLDLAIVPFCSAQGDESTYGKSATGKISWEIRPPADNRSSTTIWLWPDDRLASVRERRSDAQKDNSGFGLKQIANIES